MPYTPSSMIVLARPVPAQAADALQGLVEVGVDGAKIGGGAPQLAGEDLETRREVLGHAWIEPPPARPGVTGGMGTPAPVSARRGLPGSSARPVPCRWRRRWWALAAAAVRIAVSAWANASPVIGTVGSSSYARRREGSARRAWPR